MMADLVDRNDFCRACYGRGYFTDPHPREPGRTTTEICHNCRGTGFRTVLIEKLEELKT